MDKEIEEWLGVDTAIEILKESDKDFDLNQNTYILQTPDAYLTLSLEEDEDYPGKKQLSVKVSGGEIKFIKTESRPFRHLFKSEDE